MTNSDPDLVLVQRLRKRRCPDAFAELFRRYKDKVYGTAFTLAGDRAAADDIAQEVFLRVFRKIEAFQERSSFSTWLYRLTVNLALDRQRSDRRVRRLSDEVIEDARARPETVVLEGRRSLPEPLEKAELAGEVGKAVRGLSEKLSVVVVLRYLEGLAYEEIADVLELSVGTVKSRLNRAHAELAERLRGVPAKFA
jgi:RNA polymerase sigma-70 factor (ECF subfamily)